MPFSSIPVEMKQLNQWVIWRLTESEDGSKATKIPLDAKTGKFASTSDPSTWSSFEQAVAVAHKVSGIGFVLNSEHDNLSCIDLDDPYETIDGKPKYHNAPAISDRQIKIASAFNSYSELSPSGKGLHIWCIGKIPSGRRREAVEIYSSGRFMTVTGQVFNNVPIQNYQDKLSLLWNEMGPSEDVITERESKPQTDEDDYIIQVASDAVNGEKFAELFKGEWSKYYPSQSEADFALINIVAYYTQNVGQVMRIFRKSGLGKRQKAGRDPYVLGMVHRSFDRQPPPIDFDGLRNNLEAELQKVKAEAKEQWKEIRAVREVREQELEKTTIAFTSAYEKPKGLMGELVQFFYESAPLPVPEIAIATALALMAGVCGRSYNISGTGLNLYILLLGNTGCGKDSIGKNLDKLIVETLKTVPAASEFVGPGEIASPQALIKYMDKVSPSFATLAGEVTLLLKQLCHPRANRHEMGLKRLLLQLFGASGAGNTFKPMIYSDSAQNTKTIMNPAFTLIGESTPEEFYEMLSDEMVRSGFLPRFTIIEYKGKRPRMNKDHHFVKPSQNLVEKFAMLCAYSLQLNNGNNVLNVQADQTAQAMLDKFELKCHNSLNDASNETQRHLWNRAHLKALRISSLLAIGNNYINPMIDEESAMWAIKMVELDVLNLLGKFESGEIGMPSIHNDQHREIKKAFVKYLSQDWNILEKINGATQITWVNKVIPHAFISTYCRTKACFKTDKMGPQPAIKSTLLALIESGEIQELSVADKKAKGFAPNGKIYAVTNLAALRKY